MIEPIQAETIMFLAILFLCNVNLYAVIGFLYLVRKTREK